ncbi:alpha-L-arabinofuranosidase C-terminal domain-containing protein [Paenibacillus algorifonticola]|uniref:alpha-L-arabinofuranosidase C-terminal domain-containing protein n=1 Tax=Paenibacillus algorifonticola TaxID=684063 RepID=UPI003D2C69ED
MHRWETEHVDFYKRSDLFQQAIHRQYPAMKLIGSAGPDISSKNYENAWNYYKDRAAKNPDFVYAVDEHYYVKPEWLCENVHFYDKYPRNIKVFAGEYAAHHGNGMNAPHFNNWSAALGEAAFMTGLERNADVVVLASPQKHEIKVSSTMEYEVHAKSFHVIKMFCKDGE